MQWLKRVFRSSAALQYAFFAAAYLGAFCAVDHLALGQERIVVFWPADGILLGALVLMPLRRWPVALLLAIAAEYLYASFFSSNPAARAVAFSFANPLEAVLGAALLRRFLSGRRPEYVLSKMVLVYVLLTAAVTAGLGATAGALAYGHAVPGMSFRRVWETWWLSEALGLVFVTPLVLGWSGFRWGCPRPTARQGVEVLVFVGGFAACVYVVFWKYPRAVPLMVELPLIVIPFLLWAAFRFEPRTVVLICFSLAYVAVAATGMGRGFYSVAGVDAALRVLALQAYLFTVFVSVMFTSAALKDAEHGRTERRRLERWLEQADRLRLAGQLASGVAHDFNNYLAVIQGYAEILSEDSVPAARREEAIRIRDAAQRCSTLARQLQSLGREQEEATGPLDLNAVVRQCEPFLAQTMGGARRLRTGLAPGALSLVGHAPQVEEVLLNLVANARDAMPRAGVCVVETGHRLLDSRDAAQFLEGREGRYVMLGVRDEGTGMDEETRRHLFDPFFTTKGENGTGLGMAMVYDIVRKHGGCIQVESAVGRGTTVTVLFPAVSSI